MKKHEIILFLLILFGVLVVISIIGNRHAQERRAEILRSPGYTIGFIEELRSEKGKTIMGVYRYEVDWIPLKGTKGDGRLRKIGRDLYESSFPVIYNVKNPEQSAILIFPSDFEKFNLSYPDSLNWVKKIIE